MFRRRLPVSPTLIGGTVCALLVGALAFAFVSHKGIPGRDYTYVTAAFEELPASLRAGHDVRVSGVRVGQVHGVEYEGGEARVRMQLPGGYGVHRDATARIRSRSSLGQKFVEIDPGTPGSGPLGDAVISREHTQSLVELDRLLDALDPQTRAALASTVQALGGGAGGRGQDLNDLLAAGPDLLTDLGTTAAALSAEEARLVAFLAVSERLAGRFAGREGQLEALTDQLGKTLGALATDEGRPLRESLQRLPSTLEAIQPALDELADASAALRAGVHDLAPAARALGAATPDLRAGLRESTPVLGRTVPVSDLAAPAFGALAGTMEDARPLAPALRRLAGNAAPLLDVLAPYAAELNLVFARARDALSEGDANGNYLRIVSILAGAEGYTGTVPADNPGVNRNPYPAPGQAAHDHEEFQGVRP
jgi:phospholipid/cholesterol/gamma-HCH transport system substrate-binding protein